jgi:hypothetical protein
MIYVKDGIDANVSVVVAHYNEDLEWVNNIKYKTVIISKQNIPRDYPPNKGNEASSYLMYIIDNYDNLSDYTFFVHGHRTHWHHKSNIDKKINNMTFIYGYYNINEIQLYQLYEAYDPNIDVGNLFEIMFESLNIYTGFKIDYKNLHTRLCGQFYVKKENIRRHPKELYIKIYNWIMINNHSYYAGVILEHSWHYIFTGSLIDQL